MDFDKKALNSLLSLSDEALAAELERLGKDTGLGSNFKVSKSDAARIRAFLSIASEKEIAKIINQFGGNKNGRK